MEEARKAEALEEEIRRLKWRISTLETAEFECARAVSALAASEARYRKLLDDAGFPITIAAVSDSSILFANPLACAFFGIADPAEAGRRMLEFYTGPADRAGLLARLRSSGIVRDWEAVLLDGQGRSRVLIITASLITFEGQEAILATSNDITERRHAEALFRTLVESSPDGFAIADLDRRLTYVSPRAVRMFGYEDPAEILGRDLQTFFPAGEHARMGERLRSILAGKYIGPTEWTGIRQDGSALPQEINGEVLRNPDGSPHAFFFIVRDLSNRKRLERALRWAEKLESLGLMAAGIAHELNNAFQVAQGNLELAQGLGGAEPRLGEALARIQGGVDHATALAREMLDYSGRALRDEAPVDLVQVVEEGLAFWREYLASDVCLVYVPGEGLPAVQGDEGQLLKVLSALVLNAVEAMAGRSGSVVIGTEVHDLTEAETAAGFWPAAGRAGRFLRLEVRDAGAGIPEGDLDRVCDPFFTTKGPGRGLGLSAALGILRGHSACLQILSRPGEGTTVRVYLPVPLQAPVLPLAVPAARPIAAGILVAEDDDLIRELVVRKLPEWGFHPVWEARNGAEALELFREHQGDIGLLLTDATMPRMSGPEAFEAMRKLAPGLPALLMTGYSDAFGQGTAAAFGFSDFIRKPFRFHDLKLRLDAVRSGQAPPAEP